MKWTVVWQSEALDALAELWNIGPDRSEVAEASDRIDLLLKREPHSQGEERDGDARILIEPPLAIYFTVSDEDMLVTIYDVWRWGGKP
jgi:hypothetical protein